MALALLALSVGGATSPVAAGESFLDSNVKVREAIPYGKESGEPPGRPAAAAPSPPRAEDEPQPEPPPDRHPDPADDAR